MATKNSKKKNTSVVTEEKRGRGRPATFPGQETVNVLSNIPTTTRDMLREVAAKRGETINATLDRFIQNGHKAATQNRKR